MLYIESLQEGTLLWVGVLSMFRDSCRRVTWRQRVSAEAVLEVPGSGIANGS
jgi:hypothetical protein